MASAHGFGLHRNSRFRDIAVPTRESRQAIEEQRSAVHGTLVAAGGSYWFGHRYSHSELPGSSGHGALQPVGVLTYAASPIAPYSAPMSSLGRLAREDPLPLFLLSND
jgi:hypothetical protein